MNISIILNQPYPNGMASTHRVHLYAKGMVMQGHNVQVLLPVPHSDNKKLGNLKVSGVSEGINYKYTSLTSVRSKNFFLRRLHDYLGLINSGIQILKTRNNNDAIILISTIAFHIVFFKLISLLSNSIYLTECNEHPFAFARKGSLRSKLWFQKLYVNHIMSLYDGLLVISHNLLTFYKDKLKSSVHYKLIPVLVDLDEFLSLESKKENYIAYAGNLSEDKDGIYTQIRAFAEVSKIISNISFYIIGSAQRPSTKEKALALIGELGIENKVHFTGFVSREELVQYYKNASALILYKPDSIQAQYCFPSKIAEYLASGTPVVTTSTGELKNFLKDRESALLSDPNELEKLSKNLVEILSDAKLAKRISEKGFQIAKNNFDYKHQSSNIINFIYELKGLSHKNAKA
jgi:glycosyltransferase involved in cell wall biosynthesis